MAKKKTEKIKAAPVLRAGGGGEQPTPTPEQTGTRTYQIMDPWKDRDVVNLVDVKAVDGAVTEVKVNGQPAGGGGGTLAGFDIITVSITTTDNSFPFANRNLIDYDNNGELRGAFIINNNYYVDMTPMISANSTQTFNLLHKSGTAFEVPFMGVTPIISGDATHSDNTIYITGDCSITV